MAERRGIYAGATLDRYGTDTGHIPEWHPATTAEAGGAAGVRVRAEV